MENTPINQKLLLIFLRHSERIDEIDFDERHEDDKKIEVRLCDPVLTVNGKLLAS